MVKPQNSYKLKSEVWLYPSETAQWHMVSIPRKDSAKIRVDFKDKHHGWSSLPVEAQIGKTIWNTSIFFDRKSNEYILPIKVSIRKKEGILNKDKITYTIKILV